jgi:hypothetical protein
MKFRYSYLMCLFIISACTKISVNAPDFNVSTTKVTYKVGDSVVFKISGNVQNIVFYSGESNKNYEYRNRNLATGTPQLVFTSYLQTPGEPNTLQLLASTNFNGTYDATNIAAATWTDITSRASLSTGADNTTSGTVNLTDFLTDDNKPLYLAYRYQGLFNATLKQPTWTIRTFNVNNVLPDGSYLISSIDNIGWFAVDYKNPTIVWGIASTGQISINGTTTGSTNDDNDDWIVSKPLNLKKTIPDAGLPIQNLGSAVVNSYSYIYTAPGTYKVYFRAFNSSIDDQDEIIREITLTVTP